MVSTLKRLDLPGAAVLTALFLSACGGSGGSDDGGGLPPNTIPASNAYTLAPASDNLAGVWIATLRYEWDETLINHTSAGSLFGREGFLLSSDDGGESLGLMSCDKEAPLMGMHSISVINGETTIDTGDIAYDLEVVDQTHMRGTANGRLNGFGKLIVNAQVDVYKVNITKLTQMVAHPPGPADFDFERLAFGNASGTLNLNTTTGDAVCFSEVIADVTDNYTDGTGTFKTNTHNFIVGLNQIGNSFRIDYIEARINTDEDGSYGTVGLKLNDTVYEHTHEEDCLQFSTSGTNNLIFNVSDSCDGGSLRANMQF